MTKTILVVDDEVLLAHTVAEMLRSMGYSNIITETGFERTKNRITQREAELVLLDINLGNGEEGLELARLCDELKLPFIFISSYSDKETLDMAIGTNPLAYLIKPISEGNLYSTLQLVTKQQQSNTRHTVQFKDGTEQIHLPLENILYLKAENVYVNIVTVGKTYLYRGSLQSFIDKLPQGLLVQTHRSYAVNPKHIERIGANYLIIQQAEIPISRNFKHQIQAG